jgi:hypothetical protein
MLPGGFACPYISVYDMALVAWVCSSSCATCVGSLDYCTSCTSSAGAPLFLSNSKCVQTCPNGTYG